MNISEIPAIFIPHIIRGGVLFGPEKSSPQCKQKKDTKKGWHKGVSNEGGCVSNSGKIVCLETVHSRKGTAVHRFIRRFPGLCQLLQSHCRKGTAMRVVWGMTWIQDLRCANCEQAVKSRGKPGN